MQPAGFFDLEAIGPRDGTIVVPLTMAGSLPNGPIWWGRARSRPACCR